MATETGILLPSGVSIPEREPGVLPAGPQRGTVVNETDLPDELVMGAVETYFEEHASVLGANRAHLTPYESSGSLLARSNFRAPANAIEEIVLARDLAERDDDVGATMGAMLAMAFGEGMRHSHEDEVTVALFDEVAKHAKMDSTLQEIYRELMIAGSVTTVHLFTRESFNFKPQGADRGRQRSLVAPLVGIIPAEQIRVLDDDLFGTGKLAYLPASGAQAEWLREFFAQKTSAGRKAEMRRQNPVLTALLIEQRELPGEDLYALAAIAGWDPNIGREVYILNPRMVYRTTFPKGANRYPRPLLTRNFALLEAKRMLNLMDYALLQGGSNFLVVAKKGTDQRPAIGNELSSLRDTIKRASRSGVIIGDHRLSIEIITPNLTELLNAQKRNLLGRKIAMGLLRLPGFTEAAAGAGQAVLTDTEIISRVIASDRQLVRRHVENGLYDDVVTRNSGQFSNGAAKIWFPKIVLQGLQYFTDLVLKLRDRGDISRRSAVAAGGFDYDAEVQARKREKADDKIMTPAAVPFSANGKPADNGGGRPPGGSAANGAPGSQPARSTKDPGGRPAQTIARNAGETVKAIFDEEHGTLHVGVLTEAILEEYADTVAPGRITPFERKALDRLDDTWEPVEEGPLTLVPVNAEYAISDLRAMRLTTGLSVIVGETTEGALMARALVFRAPEFDAGDAQEYAVRWGFDTEPLTREARVIEDETAQSLAPVIHLHVDNGRGKVKKTIIRDKDGNVIGTEEEPDDGPDS